MHSLMPMSLSPFALKPEQETIIRIQSPAEMHRTVFDNPYSQRRPENDGRAPFVGSPQLHRSPQVVPIVEGSGYGGVGALHQHQPAHAGATTYLSASHHLNPIHHSAPIPASQVYAMNIPPSTGYLPSTNTNFAAAAQPWSQTPSPRGHDAHNEFALQTAMYDRMYPL